MSRFFGRNNNILLFGTAGVDSDGKLFLSEYAKRRAHRAAVVYFDRSFDRKTGRILITGGYSKELKDSPPVEREARLLGRFLLEQYSITEDALLYEDESMDTWENYLNSLQKYPDFFNDALQGEKRLGLVSHPLHLKRAIEIGKYALGRNDDAWYREFPTLQQDNELNEIAAMEITQQRIEQIRTAAD